MHAKCDICGLKNEDEVVKEKQILFHHYPVTKPDMCKKWLEVVGQEKLWQLPPSKLNFRCICSRHFSHSSYPGPCSKYLYRDAVPDRSLPEEASGPRPPGFVKKDPFVVVVPITSSRNLTTSSSPTTATVKTTSIQDATAAVSISTTTTADTTATPAADSAVSTSTTTSSDTTSTPCTTSTTTTVTNSLPAANASTTSTTATVTTSSPAADEALETDAEETFMEGDGEVDEKEKVTCRLCACNVNKENVTPIFPPVDSSDESLVDKINSLLPEKVQLGDGLPDHACKTCVTKVENCVYTIKRFVYADKKLRRLFEKSISAMHDHITLVKPHPLKVKRLEEASKKTKRKIHTLTLVAPQPLKVVEALRPKQRKTSNKFTSCQNSRDSASKKRRPPRKFMTLKASYNSKPVYYRILSAKTAGRVAHNPEVTASEDAADITAGEEGAHGISSGEEDGVENFAGKGVYKECNVDSVLSNIYPCSFCGETFPTRKRKRIHEKSDHVGETPISGSERRFQCNACKKTFDFAKHLKDHIRERHLPPEYKCEICRAIFTTKRRALLHSRKHSGEKLFPCKFCNERFSLFKELLVHRRVHIKKKSRPNLSCQVCGKSFSKTSLLHAHEKIHRKIICHLCGKSLTESIFKRHVEDHDRTYLCPICGKTFNSIFTFNAHKSRTHRTRPQKAETFHCSLCSRPFKDKEHLKRHMVVHSSLRNFKCDLCPSTFKHARNLHTHRKRHNMDSPMNSIAVAGTGPYTCLVCGKQFQSMAGFHRHNARHARRVANAPRRFECPTCCRRYPSSLHLKRHMIRHAVAQQPSSFYTCPRCGIFYKKKQTFDHHICRYQHSDEKPFKCSICGRTFLRRQFLLRHMEKHEKPVDLNTTVAVPEDAGTENFPPNCETGSAVQSIMGFQEVLVAHINSQRECVINYEL